MRVQKVNDNTIRIFISFTELADRDITMADLFQRSAKTEQLFWELIAQAREEVEFNLDQPFWIQATATSNDEFVITIMKQEDLVESLTKEKEKRKTSKPREIAYVFNELEDLISVTARIQNPKLKSSVFLFEGEYYLVVSGLGTGKKRLISEAILDEYGERVDITRVYLEEYGQPIIKMNAVQTLQKVFK